MGMTDCEPARINSSSPETLRCSKWHSLKLRGLSLFAFPILQPGQEAHKRRGLAQAVALHDYFRLRIEYYLTLRPGVNQRQRIMPLGSLAIKTSFLLPWPLPSQFS